jgi:UPF0755 protein
LNRSLKVIILGFAVLGFAAVVCGGFLFIISGGEIVDFVQTTIIKLSLSGRQDDLDSSISDDTSPVRFTVVSGDTPRAIAENLQADGLISDADLFVDYVRAEGLDTELEAGTYFLNQTQTLREIALALTDSRSSFIPFTVVEGWRIEEVAAAIDDNPLINFTGADFLAVVGIGSEADSSFAVQVGLPQGASMEGFLYPNTYQLPPDVTPIMLRNTLTQAFLQATGTQLFQDAAERGQTMYEIVTLASIVEREAIHADEHPLIASVYQNRLTADMRLEADPTVQYALNGQRGKWWPQITRDDYQGVISDYNTYRNFGLPPGPIANPSLSAIRAAVYPAESSYYYFRAACDGSGYHEFSTTYEEHLTNGC